MERRWASRTTAGVRLWARCQIEGEDSDAGHSEERVKRSGECLLAWCRPIPGLSSHDKGCAGANSLFLLMAVRLIQRIFSLPDSPCPVPRRETLTTRLGLTSNVCALAFGIISSARLIATILSCYAVTRTRLNFLTQIYFRVFLGAFILF